MSGIHWYGKIGLLWKWSISFAWIILVRVDKISHTTEARTLNDVTELLLHVELDLALPVVVDIIPSVVAELTSHVVVNLQLLRVGRGVLLSPY